MRINELERRLSEDFKEYNIMPNLGYPFLEIWIQVNGNDIFIVGFECETDFNEDDLLSDLVLKHEGIKIRPTYEDIREIVEKEINEA